MDWYCYAMCISYASICYDRMYLPIYRKLNNKWLKHAGIPMQQWIVILCEDNAVLCFEYSLNTV